MGEGAPVLAVVKFPKSPKTSKPSLSLIEVWGGVLLLAAVNFLNIPKDPNLHFPQWGKGVLVLAMVKQNNRLHNKYSATCNGKIF